jgi:hypothetical protein
MIKKLLKPIGLFTNIPLCEMFQRTSLLFPDVSESGTANKTPFAMEFIELKPQSSYVKLRFGKVVHYL